VREEEKTDNSLPGWNELVAEYYQDIYLFALKFLGAPEEAEDAVQETFLRAYKAKHRFSDNDAVRGWLYKIVRNVCIDRRRWWKRRKSRHNEASSLHQTVEPGEPAIMLNTLLQELPARQREIFILRHWHEFSTIETAELLGISSGSVKSHLKRAVNKMKELLLEDKYFDQ
jgi:RNA polymerase sigma-70 factor, ECF subfamily